MQQFKMPDLRPSRIVRWVREHYPKVITVILTSHDHDFYLSAMMDAGVAGYLIKKEETSKNMKPTVIVVTIILLLFQNPINPNR